MMKRTFATLAMIGAFTAPAHAAEDVSQLNPQPGQWSTVIAIYDHLQNHYLLKTSVHDDIASCSARLQNTAEQIKKAKGIFLNVAIGLVLYAFLVTLSNFLIPGGIF